MSPVWMIEGGATAVDEVIPARAAAATRSTSEPKHGDRARERNPADPRLVALAAAVREHESSVRYHAVPARPYDITLYRRLRQICADWELQRP